MVEPIVVTTDKPFYKEGETIMVTGEVKEFLIGYPVSFRINSPSGNIVSIAQIMVGQDKNFSYEFVSGESALMRAEGEYTITVMHGIESRSAEATFIYLPKKLVVEPEEPNKALPYQITLTNPTELTLKDVKYELGFDFQNEEFFIAKLDPREFKTVTLVDENTVLFEIDTLGPHDAIDGLVGFGFFDEKPLEDRKSDIKISLTANGITKQKSVDPVGIIQIEAIINLIEEGTEAAEKLFDFGVKVYEIAVPCVSQNDINYNDNDSLDEKVIFSILIDNCSNHKQKVVMSANIPGTTHVFDARQFDMNENDSKDISLTIFVPANLSDGYYPFDVTSTVIFDLVGAKWNVTSSTGENYFEVNRPHIVPEFPLPLVITALSFLIVFVIMYKFNQRSLVKNF
ncbi:MAG: hypothetical protein OEQ12_07765 [Nitrosopumilus sp.]|nr:hypothetical protein [Nitrosopumilus sp.]